MVERLLLMFLVPAILVIAPVWLMTKHLEPRSRKRARIATIAVIAAAFASLLLTDLAGVESEVQAIEKRFFAVAFPVMVIYLFWSLQRRQKTAHDNKDQPS